MKQFYLKQLFVALFTLCCMVANARTTATVDGITYEFITEAKHATVIKSESGSYRGNIVIPETVEYNGAVYSVTAIGNEAFYFCDYLTSITIPNSVTTIGSYAFYSCYDLTSVTIPNSVTTIGEYAFSGCRRLTSITIPNSVTTIEDDAFSDCDGLTSIVVESGNTNYDSREGCNAIIETATNTLVVGCKNTVIPNSVTEIDDSAFYGCTGLTSVTIPNSVTAIGLSAFEGSGWWNNQPDGLIYNGGWLLGYKGNEPSGDIVIIDDTKRIADYAFYYCDRLTSITIPNSVTTIGNSAFSGCTGLESIYLMGDVPPAVGYYNFTDTQYENVELYVPEGTLATYQAADVWKEFKNIREFDTTGIEDVVANDACNGRPNTYYNLRGQAVEHPTRGIYIHNGKKVFIK